MGELYDILKASGLRGGTGGGSGFAPTQEQLDAMNSGINGSKVAQIETNKNNISLKANTSDVNTATASLQAQIDQIAQAAGTGSADTEVAQARVSEDGTEYTTLKERLDTEFTTINAFVDEFTELEAEWNEGGYIVPTTGAIASFTPTANLRYYYSDRMRVDAVKSITFNQYYRAGGGAAFYDAEGVFISGSDNTGGTYGDSITLQVPTNAFYFALTASTNTVTHVDHFPNLLTDVTPESLRKGIPALVEEVSAIMEDYPQIKAFADEFTVYNPTWNPNGYISHANGNVGSWTPTARVKYYYSDRLRCDNVKQITMEQYFTGSAGAAFYDASGTFISGVSNSGSFGDLVTIDVPDHACFFATTARSDTATGADLFPNIKISVTLDSIGKGIFTQEEEFALQKYATKLASENPLDHIPNDGGYFETFRKIAIIGDSLASGEVYYKNPDQSYSGADKYEYSWGSYIARKCGSEVVHFARGGMTTRSWLATYVGQDFEDSKAQAYIIGLQVNDRFPHLNPETGQTETAVPLGSPSDIDINDRTNNADTYYGNLASIIQYIHEVVEKAKVFVITDPRKNDDYNTAVRYMATIFDNVYIIDLYEYGSALYTTQALGNMWVNGHLTSIGYKYAADHILTLMDDIINNNMAEFLEIPFIVSE